MPSPGLIFWIYLFECTYQGFRKEREGSGRGAGLPWGTDVLLVQLLPLLPVLPQGNENALLGKE